MNIKYELNKHNEIFKDFLLDIKNYFKNNSNTIHKARNELKIIEYTNIQTIVKSFKVPNKLNQIVYTFFRNSKAKKSFLNAKKLQNLSIKTPLPIGYIEFYDGFLLKHSFFVSKKYNYDYTIREPLRNKDLKNREVILKQFVSFTYNLHENEVYHKDYSAGNILVSKKDDNNFEFCLVDINRMEFKKVDLVLALGNFANLWLDDESSKLIAKHYAKLANIKEGIALGILKKANNKLQKFVLLKRKIKEKLK